MLLIDCDKLIRMFGNSVISNVDRGSEALGRLPAPLGVPVERFVKVATCLGKQIDREHSAPLILQSRAPHGVGSDLLPGNWLNQAGIEF